MEMIYYYTYQTPIGIITIEAIDDEIVGCQFESENIEGECLETPIIKEAYQQLNEYFQGKRQSFDLKFRFLKGTQFQQNVWKALLTIPYGEVVSYRDIAQMIGSPKAYRAVGNANHNNPIVVFVPCHRVITTNHQIGGYAGGVETKAYLLELEKKGKSYEELIYEKND